MNDAQKIDVAIDPTLDAEGSLGAFAPQTAHAVTQKARPLAGRVTNVALVLALVAILAFTGGAVIAAAVLSGRIDLETGWIKDVLTSLKAMAHAKH